MDLEECKEKGFIKKIAANANLIKSLIEMSKIKESEIKRIELNETNVSAYLPMAYDSLREILEAICVSKGYKVTSHLCIGELLKNLTDYFDFYSFDRFRYIRNSINYYGKKIGLGEGKEIISKILLMRKNLLKACLKEYL